MHCTCIARARAIEVVVEALLDELEQPVGLEEGLEQSLVRRREQHVGLRARLRHDLPPEPVDLRGANDYQPNDC